RRLGDGEKNRARAFPCLVRPSSGREALGRVVRRHPGAQWRPEPRCTPHGTQPGRDGRSETGGKPERDWRVKGGVGFEEPGCGRVRGRAAARDARAPPEAPPPRGNRVVKRRGWKERRGRRKEGPRELESRRA